MKVPTTKVYVPPRGGTTLARAMGMRVLATVQPLQLLARHFPPFHWMEREGEIQQCWGPYTIDEQPRMPWACWLELARWAAGDGDTEAPCCRRVEVWFDSKRETLEQALIDALEAIQAMNPGLPPFAVAQELEPDMCRAGSLEMDPARALCLLAGSRPPLYSSQRMLQLPPQVGWVKGLRVHAMAGNRP